MIADRGELEIEVEFEDGEAKVEIKHMNGRVETLTLDTTDKEEIIDEIVELTNLSEATVRDIIKFEDDSDDEDEDEDSDDDDDDDDN